MGNGKKRSHLKRDKRLSDLFTSRLSTIKNKLLRLADGRLLVWREQEGVGGWVVDIGRLARCELAVGQKRVITPKHPIGKKENEQQLQFVGVFFLIHSQLSHLCCSLLPPRILCEGRLREEAQDLDFVFALAG